MSQTMTMEPEHHQEPGYGYPDGHSPWGGGNPGYHSHHQSPVQEHDGFAFNPLPLEPAMYAASSMPPPRTYQPLQPLIQPQWPSMMTSQSNYTSSLYSAGPLPSAPLSTPIPAPTPTGRSSTNPRKTLTDADRRRMCQYAEDHPNVKQTEIGLQFGVERSTVSKVLRNKEKYLYQDEGSRSPVRKSKGKFPDIERTLANWAKNHEKQGLPMSDALIKEKFRTFSLGAGNPEAHLKANTSWLEKFKQKNNLMGMGSKSRKNSVADESDPPSGTHTPSISPTSPPMMGKEASPSAMSITKNEDRIKSESPLLDSDYGFSHSHKPYHSLSDDRLSSAYENGSSSFSPDPTSPNSPYYSQEPSPFNPHAQPRLRSSSNAGGYQRPRSQTFPMIGVEPGTYISPPSSEPLTPKYMTTSALDHSPLGDMHSTLSGVEEMHEHSSTMQPPPMVSSAPHGLPHGTSHGLPLHVSITQNGVNHHSSPGTPSSSIQSPNSPTLEDTRRALEVVMTYFQSQPNGFVEPQEYVTIGKLMQKLQLQPHQIGGEMPGGMHRIPSGDFNQGGFMGKHE